MLCTGCYGLGMAPTAQFVEVAASGPLGRLLRQLPRNDKRREGELVDFLSAVRCIISFLGHFHWSDPAREQEGEHELFIVEDRLHFRVATLKVVSRATVTVDYRFLNIVRSGAQGYRMEYTREAKAWR